MKTILLKIYIFILFSSLSFAQVNNSANSLSTILNPDGSIKTGSGNQYNGSYDTKGFTMELTKSGSPVFTTDAAASGWVGGYC